MPRAAQLKCYFGCNIDGPLHRFPKWENPHAERFNQWKSVLDSATQEKGNNYIFHCIRFCHKHFEDYFQSPPKYLTRNAVPTLHLTLLRSPPPEQEHIVVPSTSRSSQNQTVAAFVEPEPTSTPSRSSICKYVLLLKIEILFFIYYLREINKYF